MYAIVSHYKLNEFNWDLVTGPNPNPYHYTWYSKVAKLLGFPSLYLAEKKCVEKDHVRDFLNRLKEEYYIKDEEIEGRPDVLDLSCYRIESEIYDSADICKQVLDSTYDYKTTYRTLELTIFNPHWTSWVDFKFCSEVRTRVVEEVYLGQKSGKYRPCSYRDKQL